MKQTSNKFSPEVRSRAVRLVVVGAKRPRTMPALSTPAPDGRTGHMGRQGFQSRADETVRRGPASRRTAV